jgi:hypothetical protein
MYLNILRHKYEQRIEHINLINVQIFMYTVSFSI